MNIKNKTIPHSQISWIPQFGNNNTKKATRTAVNKLNAFIPRIKNKYENITSVKDIFDLSPWDLNKVMFDFVLDLTKNDGVSYKNTSLHTIVLSIERAAREFMKQKWMLQVLVGPVEEKN